MGCPVDPRLSIAWYSKAAVQEEHQSELALSGWYLTGSEGVLQQSDTEAYLWARKAAQSGLAKAEYAMGYFTEVVGPDQYYNSRFRPPSLLGTTLRESELLRTWKTPSAGIGKVQAKGLKRRKLDSKNLNGETRRSRRLEFQDLL